MAVADIKMLDLLSNLKRTHSKIICRPYSYNSCMLNRSHVHDHVQLWYCRKGEYLHSISGSSLIYGEGSLVIIPPGTVHTFMTFPETDTELYEIILRPESLDALRGNARENAQFFCFASKFFGSDFSALHFSDDEKKILEETLSLLHEIVTRDLQSECKEANRLLEKFWMLPSFYIADDTAYKTGKFMDEKFFPFLRALKFIGENFSQSLRQRDILDACLLPRNVFQTLFRMYTGTNLATYITWLRIHRASYFVGYSQYSFEYIADVCGFCNVQYMTSRFREYYGYTPYKPRMKYKRNIASLPEKKIGTTYNDKVLSEKERIDNSL